MTKLEIRSAKMLVWIDPAIVESQRWLSHADAIKYLKIILLIVITGAATVDGMGDSAPVINIEHGNYPIPGLIVYFDAIWRGDKTAALSCWSDDKTNEHDANLTVNLIPYVIDEAIASAKLKQALANKLPDVYAKSHLAAVPPFDSAKLNTARFVVFHNLAIVRWGEGVNDSLPMKFDDSDSSHAAWKISVQQWYEAIGSSVGDSILRTGWSTKTTDLVTQDILDGKIITVDELHSAWARHMEEVMEPEPVLRELKQISLALRVYARQHQGLLPRSLDELRSYTSTDLAHNHPHLLTPGANLDKLSPRTIILEATGESGQIGQVRADDSGAMISR